MTMNISSAARASGLSARMIRHYEDIGLIPPARRSESGYRHFSEQDVETLRFIRRARELGFSMDETRELVSLWRNRAPSARVKALAQHHLEDLEARIREMLAMAETLRELANHCEGDDKPDCPIIDQLSGQADVVPRPEERLPTERSAEK